MRSELHKAYEETIKDVASKDKQREIKDAYCKLSKTINDLLENYQNVCERCGEEATGETDYPNNPIWNKMLCSDCWKDEQVILTAQGYSIPEFH